MRKTLLMLLAFMLSIGGWSQTNHLVSVSSSDNDAGGPTRSIKNEGVRDRADYRTSHARNAAESKKVGATYTVAGDPGFGSFWSPTDTNNDMELVGNGLYRLVKENVALSAGEVQLKVCKNHSWDESWGNGEYMYNNYRLPIPEDGIYTITVTFDELTKKVSASAVKTDDPIQTSFTVTVKADPAEGGYVQSWIVSGTEIDRGYESTDGYRNSMEWVTAEDDPTIGIYAEPLAGYRFLGWYDGEEQIYGPEYNNENIVFTPTESKTYTAKFELIPTYTITVEKNIDGGEASVWLWSGEEVAGDDRFGSWIEVQENSEAYLYANADEGYRFLGWYDGEEQIYGPEYNNQNIVFTPTESKTYTAKFELIPVYTVTVIADPIEGGSVDVWSTSDEIEWGYEADWKEWVTVWENTGIYIYANADEGYRFLGWYDGEEQIYGPEYNNQNIVFTPTESKTYTAKFEEIPVYTISVSTQPAGIFEEESYGIYVHNNSTGEQSESSLGIQEGATFDIYAATNGDDLYSHLKFDHWESDKGRYAGTLNIIYNLESLEDEHWTAVYEPNFGDYTQVGTTNLYSKDNGNAIDIKGVEDNKFYQSTYADAGYEAAIKVGDNVPYALYNGIEIDDVTVNTSVLQSGAMARVVYTVRNNGSTSETISLGTHADVMIGNNDKAPIQAIKDDNEKTIGIVMSDGDGGQLYVIFGLGVAGVSLIDDYWFGLYNENRALHKMVGAEEYSFDYPEYAMLENGSYDSGMGWCWKNRTIEPGQTIMYSFMVGIGEVKMEPSASVTLTPLDMDSWNDLSATHEMYAEGIYTHTTGVDGYLEYQVETKDDDKWATLVTDPERLQSDAYFHGTFNVKFDPSKPVHMIHFRTRDLLGNYTSLPSQQFEDLSDYTIEGEIVDKTYNGEAQTQDVLLPGIEAGKYTVSYQNNINAGTATVVLAGSFPHTIGFKQFNFTINPKPLVGTIVFNTSGFVYDGYAHRPSWTLANYSLVENKDYTATWSKNILPGTASLTITGKGNYSGSLNANFVIDKATVDANMYTVKLPVNALYDGEQHVAVFTKKNSEIGDASFFYYNNSTLQNPIDKGEYAVRLEIEENALYHGFTTYVGSFTIWRMDAAEWTALQAIYAELSVRNWKNRWDMSKGEAGAGSFQGVTFNQGHVVELNLAENEIDGTFPLSVLSLPYMTSLDLSNNSLSGDIEDGIIEYVQAHPIAAPARAKAEENTITVYVQKPAEWSGMNVYSWTDNAVLTHSWPGDPMSDRGDGWWVYSGLPVGANVVFNDGTGYSNMQTGDIMNIQYSTAYTLQASTGHTSMGNVPYTVASAVVVQNGIILPKGLKTVNISHNELEGNIGLFAQALPKLVSLNASFNHISDVAPMLSTAITQLNLDNQIILGTRVIDLPAVAGDYEALLPIFPSIMLYNHDAQNYLPTSNTIVSVKDDLEKPQFEAEVVVTDWINHEWEFACNENANVFRYTAEDELFVTKENTASRFAVKINFGNGDANFSGTTDVLDLQASINFIFGEYSNLRPFNFTAANLFKDETINVQDIVLLTELLLADEQQQSAPRRVIADEADEQATAELRWENGELHLTSETPVAALDITISANAAIEWLVPTHDVLTKETARGHHAVIYSLEGNTLAGKGDVVIARSNDLAPVTVKAVLADSDAMPISVRRITVDAKVPTGTENAQDDSVRSMKVMRDGVLYIERGGNTYDATGRLIKK